MRPTDVKVQPPAARGTGKENSGGVAISVTNTPPFVPQNVPLVTQGLASSGYTPSVKPLGDNGTPPTVDRSQGNYRFYTEPFTITDNQRIERRVGGKSLILSIQSATFLDPSLDPLRLYIDDSSTPILVYPIIGYQFAIDDISFEKLRLESGNLAFGTITVHITAFSRTTGFRIA